MQGSFSDDSLQAFSKLASEFQEVNYRDFGDDTHDFSRCVRPDGSAYGTRGKCRKGVQSELAEILKRPLIGRVPRNNPKEPLASGDTPLEKAEAKLAMFGKLINDPNRTPSEKELEQYGKLKYAIEFFKNKKDGRQVPILQRDLLNWEDRSDLDKSKSRELGKQVRAVIPNPENRKKFANARRLYQEHLDRSDPLGVDFWSNERGELLWKRMKELEKAYLETKVLDIMGKYKGKSSVPILIDRVNKGLQREYDNYRRALDAFKGNRRRSATALGAPKEVLKKWSKRPPTDYERDLYNLDEIAKFIKYNKDGTIPYDPWPGSQGKAPLPQ